jgi:2-polyprenyl-6-methoxyphenol hydroxylase-like FAD-dependent oxidoreductase
MADATLQVQKNGQTVCRSVVVDTYTDEEIIIESSIVIGCDGANSRVRKASNIKSEGEESGECREWKLQRRLQRAVSDRIQGGS